MTIRGYFCHMEGLPARSPIRQTLGRDKRLKSRKAIAALFEGGERLQVPLLRVRHRLETGRTAGVKTAFSASSRVFRRAVDRNLVKRLMREAWRRQVGPLEAGLKPGTGGLDIFLVHSGKELPVYVELYVQVGKVIESLRKRYCDGH